MSSLLLAEISQKQSYIFNSRNPEDIIGASIIIRKLTQEEFYGDYSENQNLRPQYKDKLVFAGGGGFALKFNSREEALAWNREYSLRILREYPGVEYISSVEVEPEGEVGTIDKRLEALRNKQADKKKSRSFSFGLKGLGVERTCTVSGLPAAKDQSISEQFVAKRQEYENSRDDYYKSLRADGFGFPSKEDVKRDLGKAIGNSKGESSYIGLIAIDGNKMGKKVKEFFEEVDKSNDDKYIEQYREFTMKIDKLYRTAMKKTVEVLAGNLEELESIGLKLRERVVPIVHIVLSGDDISFVVDGRIAIECAKVFLDELSKLEGGNYKACAGVAIANTGYPYWKLSEIAEDLLKNGKKVVARDDTDACVIDWQIIEGDFDTAKIEGRFTAKPFVIDSTVIGNIKASLWSEFQNAENRLNSSGLANSVVEEIRSRLQAPEQLKQFKDNIKDPDKKTGVGNLLYGDRQFHRSLYDAIESERFNQWNGGEVNYGD